MNENLDTKKRIYEILEKLSSGYDFDLSPDTFSPDNEMIELIDLLTNHNPYKPMQPVQIYYADVLGGNPNTLGQYWHNQDIISYNFTFVQDVADRKSNFMLLLDTIYHEQRHHYQDYLKANPALIHSPDFKQITDDLFNSDLTTDEIKELNDFANQHNILGKIFSKLKLKKLQFGAYAARKSEVDARDSAFNDTAKTFKMIIDDPDCNPKVKKFLSSQFKQYDQFHKEDRSQYERSMKSFKHLDEKVKSTLMLAVKSNHEIDKDTYSALLNGILDYVTKSVTLHENLEIAGWALQNNYTELLTKINLQTSNNFDPDELSNFISAIVSKGLITSQNFTYVCCLFSSFGNAKDNAVIPYLIDNLADQGYADVLLNNSGIGGALSFYSQHITPKILDVAFANYLNKIEQTKTITDYDKYLALQQSLNNRLDGRFIDDKSKALLLEFTNRFNKINANTEIKIIKKPENEKEETLGV